MELGVILSFWDPPTSSSCVSNTLVSFQNRPNGVCSSKHVIGQVEHKVDMAAFIFIFHQSRLNSHTGHFNSVRGSELSSLVSYRQTNCEAERPGSRIMNISTHRAFFWPGFSVQTGKVCLFQKFSICFLFLANPSFIGLFPALLAYRLITLFSAPCPFWEKRMQPENPFFLYKQFFSQSDFHVSSSDVWLKYLNRRRDFSFWLKSADQRQRLGDHIPTDLLPNPRL